MILPVLSLTGDHQYQDADDPNSALENLPTRLIEY